jgi:large repetitive protein
MPKITYTYDENLQCLSGYKIDGCTGLPLPSWKIVVKNATHEWNTTTNAKGLWQICGLENDTYTVCEVLEPGWVQTSTPVCHAVTLAGINITNQNFTNQKLLCISGFKINSSTGLGLPGWNITLRNATATVTKKTGPNGKYEFCNLLPGSYSLTEEMQPGYMVVKKVFNPFTLGCENITNKNFTNQKVPTFAVCAGQVVDRNT